MLFCLQRGTTLIFCFPLQLSFYKKGSTRKRKNLLLGEQIILRVDPIGLCSINESGRVAPPPYCSKLDFYAGISLVLFQKYPD